MIAYTSMFIICTFLCVFITIYLSGVRELMTIIKCNSITCPLFFSKQYPTTLPPRSLGQFLYIKIHNYSHITNNYQGFKHLISIYIKTAVISLFHPVKSFVR